MEKVLMKTEGILRAEEVTPNIAEKSVFIPYDINQTIVK